MSPCYLLRSHLLALAIDEISGGTPPQGPSTVLQGLLAFRSDISGSSVFIPSMLTGLGDKAAPARTIFYRRVVCWDYGAGCIT